MGFYRYKAQQGKYARALTALLLGVGLFLASYELYMSELFYPDENTKIIYELPLINVPLTKGLIAVCVFFIAGLFVIAALTYGYRSRGKKAGWLQKKSEATIDFLIEVEGELRKVAWPSRQDLVNSTLVVIITVLIFGVLLLGMDKAVEFFMRKIGIY